MALDTTTLSQTALGLIERLAEEYDEFPNVEVGVVGLIVELTNREPDDNEPSWTTIEYRCTDPRGWIQGALFHRAADAALERR